jgi:hypothetical protein
MATVSHNRILGHASDDPINHLSDVWTLPVSPAVLEVDVETDPPVTTAEELAESYAAAMPFQDWIKGTANLYRLQGTPASLWLAGQLDELASWAKRCLADTPEKFDARRPVLEEIRDDELRQEGWSKGYQEGFHDGQNAALDRR